MKIPYVLTNGSLRTSGCSCFGRLLLAKMCSLLNYFDHQRLKFKTLSETAIRAEPRKVNAGQTARGTGSWRVSNTPWRTISARNSNSVCTRIQLTNRIQVAAHVADRSVLHGQAETFFRQLQQLNQSEMFYKLFPKLRRESERGVVTM